MTRWLQVQRCCDVCGIAGPTRATRCSFRLLGENFLVSGGLTEGMESCWFMCVHGMVREPQKCISPAPDGAAVRRGVAFGQPDLRGECPSSCQLTESLGGERSRWGSKSRTLFSLRVCPWTSLPPEAEQGQQRPCGETPAATVDLLILREMPAMGSW